MPPRGCLPFAAWLLAAARASQTSGGQATCPCIDSSAYLQGCSLRREGHCFSADYGSSTCKTHDAGMAECDVAEPPPHCSMKWCFVDGEACRNSVYDLHAMDFPDPSDVRLPFSYGTCGEDPNRRYYGDRLIEDNVAGTTIVAGMPCMQYPLHYKLDAKGEVAEGIGDLYRNDSHPWLGSMIDYFNTVSFYGSFRVNYTWVGEGARVQSKQWWTSTVRDVAHGVSDIGVSDFWLTVERAAMAPFTVPVGRDIFMLWVPRPMQDNTVRTMMMKPLRPFHNSLWFALIAIGAVSFLLDFLWSPGPLPCTKFRGGRSPEHIQRQLESGIEIIEGRLAHSQILGAEDGEKSAAQLILGFGWMLVVFMLSAAYTANLASILTESDVSKYIKSLDEAIDEGVTICAVDSFYNELIIRFPKINSYIRSFNVSAPTYEEFISKGCGVIVYSQPSVLRSQKGVLEPFCKLDLVPVQEVTSVLVSFPVKRKLFASMSYWMQYTYKETSKEFFRDYDAAYGISRCESDGRDITSLDVEVDEQLHAIHFLLPFVVWFAAVFFGTISFLYKRGFFAKLCRRGKGSKVPNGSGPEKSSTAEEVEEVKPEPSLREILDEVHLVKAEVQAMKDASTFKDLFDPIRTPRLIQGRQLEELASSISARLSPRPEVG